VTVLRGERVVLRPLRLDELDELVERRNEVEGIRLLREPGARERLRRQIERSGRFADGRIEFAIDVENRLAGTIDARCPERFMPPGVYELGIVLFDPADRGKGYGREAIRLLVRHLFEDRDAGRVQGGTALENRAMRRVFEQLGFTEEGVMRAFMPTPSGRDDYVLYAITREDWTKLER
jgi:diamine N-acetyltransferase